MESLFSDEEIMQMYIAEERRNAALAGEKRGERRGKRQGKQLGIRQERRRLILEILKDNSISEQQIRRFVPGITQQEITWARKKLQAKKGKNKAEENYHG